MYKNICRISMSFMLLLCGSSLHASAFHLSMVSSTSRNFGSASSARRGATSVPKAASPFGSVLMPPKLPGIGGGGITSGLISKLAVVALKLRLKAQTNVSCDVTANEIDLILRGAVGPVTVRGRGWQSGLGLTCRAIEATVDSCEVDTGKILSDQKLALKTPARGRAMIALNAVDFANFIAHPLMQPPTLEGASHGDKMEFVTKNVSIDSHMKTVTFRVTYQGVEYECILRRGQEKKAIIEVERADNEFDASGMSNQISQSLSNFFNDMVFELDGTYLNFKDMMVTEKGSSPSVMLSLNITVKKFPSRDLAF